MDVSRRWTWLDAAWLLAFGLASSLWCVTAAGRLGATFDEPFYVQSGVEGWRSFSHFELLRKGTMPLPVDVQTLPIALWERCQGVTLDPVGGLNQILPWARGMNLVFWWLLLVHAFLLGRMLAGPWAGRLAVALIAVEPSFLAHASLATTDVSVTALVTAFLYHYLANRDGGWLRRVAWPGLWLGLALSAKVSGLVFGGLCLAAVEAARLWKGNGDWRRSLSDAAAIGALGTAVAFVYCGSDFQPQPGLVAWSRGLPEGFGRDVMVWIADHLCIFNNAGVGIVRQVRHNAMGHGVYLLGETHPRALWYYFPVLMTIKLTLPLLILPAVVLLVRRRALLNAAVAAAFALMMFSVVCRVQIGIRLMLPMVALICVGVAVGLVRACRELGPTWRSRLLAGAATLGVGWAAVAAAMVWPHGLCYVNEAWGGSAHGYRLVSDANYDWGQGLDELASWQRERGVNNLDVWYYGTDPRADLLPMRHRRLHQMPLTRGDDVRRAVSGRYLAVGTTLRHGSFVGVDSVGRVNEFLDGREPVARTTTFLIYDFTRD